MVFVYEYTFHHKRSSSLTWIRMSPGWVFVSIGKFLDDGSKVVKASKHLKAELVAFQQDSGVSL